MTLRRRVLVWVSAGVAIGIPLVAWQVRSAEQIALDARALEATAMAVGAELRYERREAERQDLERRMALAEHPDTADSVAVAPEGLDELRRLEAQQRELLVEQQRLQAQASEARAEREDARSMVIFGAGAAFIFAGLVISLLVGQPTTQQQFALRVAMAIGAGLLGAEMAGFLNLAMDLPPGVLEAGGGFGLFCVVYFFNPASLKRPPGHEEGPEAT